VRPLVLLELVARGTRGEKQPPYILHPILAFSSHQLCRSGQIRVIKISQAGKRERQGRGDILTFVSFVMLPGTESARCVNHQPGAAGDFGWQDGYGALTFGARSLADVIAYVRGQKEHHSRQMTRPLYERMTADEDGVVVVADAAAE
jgi:hypothetical protein